MANEHKKEEDIQQHLAQLTSEQAGDSIILETRNLKKYYPIRRGFNPFQRNGQQYVRAVDDVSIKVPKGKTVAILGESGCGKTTLAKAIALLSPPTSGEIIFNGQSLTFGKKKKKVDYKKLYREMQMVFQDPDSSLDPTLKVKDSIAEPCKRLLTLGKGEDIETFVMKSLKAVGLSAMHAERIPAHLSGGQKQRVAIARAIAPQPKIVILDEPTSALDASVQAQILNLLLDLQKNFNLTYLIITHNISVAEYLSDILIVMYAGNVVEYGPSDSVISKPRHPYTITLISAAPIPNPWKRNLLNTEIRGEVPSAINPPSGCKFHPRCTYAGKRCSEEAPELKEISPGHFVSCHFAEKTA
ncbi:MAG: ABC transporter ATP-binding protein [archaeon]|nr:ABC transporter ATP-binding protein [archaeon]